jgi:alkylated DNA repair dioxygenase AlkB
MGDLFSSVKILPFPIPSGEEYNHKVDNGIFYINIPNGVLIFAPEFFNKKESDRAVEYLLENENGIDFRQTDCRAYEKEKLDEIRWRNIKWHHDKIKMFGKEVYLPRYSAWYAEANTPYTYSGLKLVPNVWDDNSGLQYIRSKIEPIAQAEFNSVLLNWYRDGNDHISWHTDAEKELGINPVIASVNFGDTRIFSLRKNDDQKTIIDIPLSHGSLLVMGGATQHFWQHAVKKQPKVKGVRINLTFRKTYSQ